MEQGLGVVRVWPGADSPVRSEHLRKSLGLLGGGDTGGTPGEGWHGSDLDGSRDDAQRSPGDVGRLPVV